MRTNTIVIKNSFINGNSVNKKWIPIADFLVEAAKLKGKPVTMREIYNRIQKRDWWDGYVIKKNPNTERYAFGCVEDYKKWLGLL